MLRLLGALLLAALTATAPAAQTVRVKNLKVLCVVYRGDPAAKDHMDEHAVLQAKNGAELGRLFYFRNSRARLNCELTWLVFDQAPPKNDGPTMEFIEAHLKQQGVQAGQYDGVFVTGVGLCGNFGGFEMLGGAGGCFGQHDVRGNLEWYPEDKPDAAYGTAWIFAHEFQHALDLVICESSGRKDMLHDHPFADKDEPYFRGNYQGGEHWDWVALCLREFDGYLDIKGVTKSFLDCVDTDGDGLDDLGEFVADRYAGSDPRQPDTDGDGLKDGEDPYPVVAIAPTLGYRVSQSGGAQPAEPPLLLNSVFVRNDEGGECVVRGVWTEQGLSLSFLGPRKLTVHMKLDGSAANGFWEGGDTYVIRIADGEVKFDGLGLNGPVPGATARGATSPGGNSYVMDVAIPARIGQGISKEINYGGPRDPQDVVDGLTLVAGRSIAFNISYEFEDHKRALLTPLHTMYAVKLVKPADAPEAVLLRGPAETNAALPSVNVLGARPTSRIEVVSEDGRVVGARIGPGPLLLAGLKADGTYTLTARTADAKSEPHRLLVKRTAAPPKLLVKNGLLSAECEPNAEFELWWGLGELPVAPLGGARADGQGQVSLPVGDKLLRGWVVTGFDGGRFQKPVFIETWEQIDKNFEDRAPDPRLPPDRFSLRFEGYLQIDTPDRYTLELSSDDGSRLWLDDELAIDNWGHHGLMPRSATLDLEPGLHRARIDYYEDDGWAGVKLLFGRAGQALTTDMPVRRLPVPPDQVILLGVQTDRLGNRSGFTLVPGPDRTKKE